MVGRQTHGGGAIRWRVLGGDRDAREPHAASAEADAGTAALFNLI
jgi:hypothetical protein